jgi:hypothetical protein
MSSVLSFLGIGIYIHSFLITNSHSCVCIGYTKWKIEMASYLPMRERMSAAEMIKSCRHI